MHHGRGFQYRLDFAARRQDPSMVPDPAEEMSNLEEAARRLEYELKSVRARIEKLQSTK